MKIKIAGLREGRYEFRFEGNTEELELNEPFSGSYLAEIRLDKSVHQMLLHADCSADIKTECDRCGIQFEKKLSFTFEIVYLFEQKLISDDESSSVVYLLPETDKIDIGQDMYDFAHLAVPMKRLCREDCKGLCPQCGTDLNMDKCSCESEKESNSPFRDLKKLINKN